MKYDWTGCENAVIKDLSFWKRKNDDTLWASMVLESERTSLPYGFNLTRQSGIDRLTSLMKYTNVSNFENLAGKCIRVFYATIELEMYVLGFGHIVENKFITDFKMDDDNVREVTWGEFIKLLEEEEE